MNLRVVLIAAKACIISSMVARAHEDYGFEIVSDIGHWLEMESTNIAFMPDRPFLRGSNYTVEENLEVDYEWNSNATLIDYGNGDLDERELAQLSVRDRQWLNSHNKRRRKYHNKFNKKYIPLKWSPKLKRSSKKWAKHLANQCGQGIYHDPKNNFGENLASNWGTGSWARKPSTESVLTRLVENEEGLNYPENGHFTQVLWRGTSFVGCAEHTKVLGSGKKCHVQVCRYAKPGNCNMGRYQSYKVPMLADDSPCGPSI